MTGLLRAGDLLAGRYLLTEPIGQGGMSTIWRAVDERLGRPVAVKVVDAAAADDDQLRELIRREARATARIRHDGTVEVYDYGEAVMPSGHVTAYAVMPLLDGQPLAARIAGGPLPWREAVDIAGNLAAVLAAAHRQGIVHRDVTAENVLLTDGGIKLLDFGIAAAIGSLDQRTREFGTPPYVAPERLSESPAQPAADVYALGVLLFEMLTGTRPYPENTWAELESAQRSEPPPLLVDSPDLPAAVAQLCQRCLSLSPAMRPTAEEIADRLEDAARRAVQRRSRRRLRYAAVLGAFVAGLAAAIWMYVDQHRAPTADRAGTLLPVEATSTPTESPAAQPAPGQPTPPRDSDPTDLTPSVLAVPPGTGHPLPASPDEVLDALAAFEAILDRARADEAIRPDVALDLQQLAANLAWDGANQADQLADLRRKLDDRLREGALTGAVWGELQAELTTLAGTLPAAP